MPWDVGSTRRVGSEWWVGCLRGEQVGRVLGGHAWWGTEAGWGAEAEAEWGAEAEAEWGAEAEACAEARRREAEVGRGGGGEWGAGRGGYRAGWARRRGGAYYEGSRRGE